MRGMSKRILLIQGHPDAGNRHFGHALADAYLRGAHDAWCCSCRSETTYRVWRLNMAGGALEFEAGGTGIYQILASKRNRREWPVPLSRRNLDAGRDGRFGGVT